ncbi:MAG: ATP-binding cassette domain-containing protein [Nitrososphaeraceae archaeon]|nr:ATP-binding cassette domain-containing protein [Nitrososphaeraceae archaeon]
MIRIEELSKKLGNFQLGPLDLHNGQQKQEIIVVLGETGSGKTTLLNLIAGIHEPDQGRIFLGQNLLNGIPIEKRRIGYVLQELYLFPHMSCYRVSIYSLLF